MRNTWLGTSLGRVHVTCNSHFCFFLLSIAPKRSFVVFVSLSQTALFQLSSHIEAFAIRAYLRATSTGLNRAAARGSGIKHKSFQSYLEHKGRMGLRAVTEVHLAAAAGDVAGIKDALEAAPRGCFLCPKDPANEQDAGGNTPLMLATKEDHAKAVSALLEAGARPNRANSLGWRPLHVAAGHNFVASLRALLAGGADPNRGRRHDKDKCTPLHSAAQQGHVEAIELLLGAKADPNVRVEGWAPLDFVASAGNTRAVQALLSAKARPSAADKNGTTPLLRAARGGHTDTVAALLSGKANPDGADKQSITPLHVACESGYTDMARALLEAGARPNCSNSRGETPLHHASKTGAYQIVVALLAAKAKPNVAAGQDGATPLILAAQKGYTEVAEALLAAGAKPNVTTKDGQTALHHAARGGFTDVVMALLTAGAKPNIKATVQQSTPLHLAARGGHVASIQALLEASADVEAFDADKNTPLHEVANNWHEARAVEYDSAAQVLLGAGANPQAFNRQLKTPLSAACTSGRHTGWLPRLLVQAVEVAPHGSAINPGGTESKKTISGYTLLAQQLGLPHLDGILTPEAVDRVKQAGHTEMMLYWLKGEALAQRTLQKRQAFLGFLSFP